jgi:AcrR family transcriptional regulator
MDGERQTASVDVEDSGDDTRRRILDAAAAAAAVHGVSRLSMSDVARTAGLSRPTIYRYFPSRDDLLAAALLAETQAVVSQVVAELAEVTDPRDAIERGILATLRLTRDHPLLDRIVRTEPEVLVPVLVTEGDPGVPAFTAVVRRTVEALLATRVADPDPVRRRRRADVIARLLVSYAVSAPDDPPEIVAAGIAEFVAVGALPLEPGETTSPGSTTRASVREESHPC